MTDDAPTTDSTGRTTGPKTGGPRRIPAGVLIALALAVLIAGGVILFLSASSGTTPATGTTTSGGLISLVLG